MLPLVVVVGPTAVGKSEMAVELALRLNGEIISADSMQVYKYFNIGTAKLTKEAQKGVPHHLIDILEPDEEFSVAQYQKLAREKIKEINAKGKLPFLVGGTGLYVQAVIDPYQFPETQDIRELRNSFRKIWATDGGKEKLYQELQRVDPITASRIHPNDFRRISRALEVYYTTGTPISQFQKKKYESLYRLAMVGLNRKRHDLYKRIEKRVELMFQEGIVEETKAILARGYDPQLKPFQSLGYKQVIGYLNGEYDLNTAIELTKKATRNYAKRQLTWFRRDPRINWFMLDEEAKVTDNNILDKIIQFICRNLSIPCRINC